MTHLRTFPVIDKNKRPALGQGFTTLTETLLDEVETTESIQGKSHAYSDDVVVREITTQQMRTNESAVSISFGAHAAFVLSVLGEFSQHRQETSQAIESFLVMMMPLRTDTVDVLKLRGALPDLKVTPVDAFFSRAGDRYVKSITYGNYFLADMALIKGEQKKEKSGNFNASGTEPTTGIGGKGKVQASQADKKSFSKDQKFMQSNRPELLVPKEGGGYDLDKTKEAFRKDAEHYRQAQRDSKDYLLPAMSFELSEYDQKAEGDYEAYITTLKACHADVVDALHYTSRYLKAFDFFYQESLRWKAEGAKLEDTTQEEARAKASHSILTKAHEKLFAYRAELEKKTAPTPVRLEEIRQSVRNETMVLIAKKEELKETTAKRLISVITLKPTEDKHALSDAFTSQLSTLQQKGIDYLYVALEGKEAKETTLNLYHENLLTIQSLRQQEKFHRCFAIQGTETFLSIGYLTAIKGLYFGMNKEEKARSKQRQDITIKLYAIHPFYDQAIALRVAVEETPYFESTVKPKLPAPFRKPGLEDPIPDEKLVRSERRWRTALMAKELTKSLPKKLSHFVERTELKMLQKGFEGEEKAAVQVIIHGMGGVGKTQLAIEYAHAMQTHFEFVCWVHAAPQTLAGEWGALGKGLGLELKGLDENSQRLFVRDALSEQPSWLLVLDNLENEGALQGLLSDRLGPKQHVLITSRSAHWGPRVKEVPLSLFTPPQAEIYFKDRLIGPRERLLKGTDGLAKELGYLPLALAQVVSYMQQHDVDGDQYLERYKQKGVELFSKDLTKKYSTAVLTEEEYKETILTTWLLSMEQLKKRNEKAAQLVKFCGYLHPDGIPEILFKKALELKEDTELDGCIGAIKDYSLLSREAEGIKIHRLVQEAIRYHEEKELSQEQQFSRHLQPLGKALSDTYPDFYNKSNDEWQLAKQLEPHIKIASDALEPFTKSTKLKQQERQSAVVLQSRLLLALGNIASIAANFKESKRCCEQALALRKEVYGEDTFETTIALVSLGDAERELGDYKKAEGHYLVSLAIREKAGDKESADLAILYNQLGLIYEQLGDVKKALENHQKALKLNLKIHGEEHPLVATSYGNLGRAYEALGDAKKALAYYEKDLAISLKVYGEVHPDVATSYSNLGSGHQALGDARKALAYYEKALAIRLKVYGEEHPDVAISYSILGSAHEALGDAKKALAYYEKALAIRLKVYGEEHPTVATSYSNLGSAHEALGDAKKALAYYEKALAIRLKVYGEEHPHVATSYSNLGSGHQALGDAKKALAYYEKDLAISLKVYGEVHPDVATSYSNLGSGHQALGDARKALAYYEKALAIRLKVYGEEHPDVAISYSTLGTAHQALGDAKKALAYYEKDLAIRLKVYGEEHPDVATSYSTLGIAHQALGDAKKALAYYEKALAIFLKVYGEEHPAVAINYSTLGTAHQVLGDAKKALAYYEKALAIFLKVYGEEHPTVATSYSNLGSAHQVLGDARKTLENQQKALTIKLKIYGEEHPEVAASYASLGSIHLALSDAKEALTCQEKALAVLLKVHGPDHPSVAAIHDKRGDVLRALKEPAQALEAYQAALSILLKEPDQNPSLLATVYNDIGETQHAVGELKPALESYQKTLAVLLKVHGPDHPSVAAIHDKIGDVRRALKEPARALEAYQAALSIFLKGPDQNLSFLATVYNDIGGTQLVLGELKPALESYKKALALYQQLGKEQEMRLMRFHIEMLTALMTAPSVSDRDRELHPVVPAPLPVVSDIQPQPVAPIPRLPNVQPQPTASSSYFSFFRNNPGKAALLVGGSAAVVALAYTYLKKPGGGTK